MGNDTKHINIGLYLWAEHAEIIKQAAHKADSSVPDYIRDVILPIASKDAGIPLPELGYQKRNPRSLVTSATAMGITADQLQLMAELLNELEERRKRPSGVYIPSQRPLAKARKSG